MGFVAGTTLWRMRRHHLINISGSTGCTSVLLWDTLLRFCKKSDKEILILGAP